MSNINAKIQYPVSLEKLLSINFKIQGPRHMETETCKEIAQGSNTLMYKLTHYPRRWKGHWIIKLMIKAPSKEWEIGFKC